MPGAYKRLWTPDIAWVIILWRLNACNNCIVGTWSGGWFIKMLPNPSAWVTGMCHRIKKKEYLELHQLVCRWIGFKEFKGSDRSFAYEFNNCFLIYTYLLNKKYLTSNLRHWNTQDGWYSATFYFFRNCLYKLFSKQYCLL